MLRTRMVLYLYVVRCPPNADIRPIPRIPWLHSFNRHAMRSCIKPTQALGTSWQLERRGSNNRTRRMVVHADASYPCPLFSESKSQVIERIGRSIIWQVSTDRRLLYETDMYPRRRPFARLGKVIVTVYIWFEAYMPRRLPLCHFLIEHILNN